MSYGRKEKISDAVAVTGFLLYGLALIAIIVLALLDILGVKI